MNSDLTDLRKRAFDLLDFEALGKWTLEMRRNGINLSDEEERGLTTYFHLLGNIEDRGTSLVEFVYRMLERLRQPSDDQDYRDFSAISLHVAHALSFFDSRKELSEEESVCWGLMKESGIYDVFNLLYQP